MGQETYALLRVRWKSIPASVRTNLRPNDGFEPYLVGNVALPGCLVWTPINYHDLSADEPELLQDQVSSLLPRDLIAANAEKRGVLLFPDGGEPRRSWRHKTSYEELEREMTRIPEIAGTRLFAWVRVDVQELPKQSSADELLMKLPEQTMVGVLAAKARGDLAGAKQVLLDQLGPKKFAQVARTVDKWLGAPRRR
jgi:hypothetical protein